MDDPSARADRLNALPPMDHDKLCRTVGEAAIDLWLMGVAWPDLVERCLEAVEEEVALGLVPVHVETGA